MRVIEKKVMINTEESSEKARASDRAATGDAVEELQAEASQQPNASKTATSLERYCDENPSASECLIYEE